MSKKLIIIIAVAVVLIGIGVGAYFYFTAEKVEEEIVDFYVPGEYFITNARDSEYLLKTTVILELNQAEKQEELAFNNAIIRDTIVFILREKTLEELKSSDIQDVLRSEIKEELIAKLGIDYLTDVYFSDFIVQ